MDISRFFFRRIVFISSQLCKYYIMAGERGGQKNITIPFKPKPPATTPSPHLQSPRNDYYLAEANYMSTWQYTKQHQRELAPFFSMEIHLYCQAQFKFSPNSVLVITPNPHPPTPGESRFEPLLDYLAEIWYGSSI